MNTDLMSYLVAAQVQLVHEEGQVVQPKLRVVAHEQDTALLHRAIWHILRPSYYGRHQSPTQQNTFQPRYVEQPFSMYGHLEVMQGLLRSTVRHVQ